jgi:hypothetical protein
MHSAKSFAEVEDAWNEYLSAIEKTWQRAKIACNANRTHLGKWREGQDALRQKDPLLRYLIQARQTDQHTIHEHIVHVHGSTKIGFPIGQGDAFIENLAVGNGLVLYNGSHPLPVTQTAPRIELKTVEDRRGSYPPPESHLGIPIRRTTNPFLVADLGLRYYQAMLDELEALVEGVA